ncbi:hypothetical protein Hanom_Chr09g00763431 [Helianthus anomalus]
MDKNKKNVGSEVNIDRNEFVEVVKKVKAQNKEKKPAWQPKKTGTGPVIVEPGPSRQGGLHISGCSDPILGSSNGVGRGKPSEKAAGLQNNNEHGPFVGEPKDFPPLKASGPDMGCYGDAAGPPKSVGPSSVLEPVLQPIVDSIMKAQKTYGSGFYDVSKNMLGSQPGPSCKTTNSFGMLRVEEECFDTDIGLWEHEIGKVKKFVETSTHPKMEEYSSWSENRRKYYDGLTKMNEDDEVASETDETARFMKSGVKS